ncbi:hypothetical protein EDB85DRAFT_2149268 [Lactarius pseudohatsudake]|nr:hypothetical protein EDB85DRAFT_2149268 [Lactarius pseudohatsudake]
MASILNLFRDIQVIYKLRLTRDFVRLFIRRCALFLAFLGRRLGILRLWDDRKRPGTCPKAEQAKRSSPSTGTSLDSRRHVIVAASSVPASAGHASLCDVSGAIQQPQRAASGTTPPSDQDYAKPSSESVCDSRIRRRSTDSGSSAQSRFSLRIIRTRSRESMNAPVGPTPSSRAPGNQFGRGSSGSSSRESSRSPSPTDRGRQPYPEIDVTKLHPPTQVASDCGSSPINPPSVAHHADAQPSVSHSRNSLKRSSTTSVVVKIVNPSTDPLPTSDFDLPDGRFLQLIHSEQVPRYTKGVTVQVEYIITTIKPLSLFGRPREKTYFKIPRLTTTFLYVSEQMGLEQGTLKEDCTPWVPATHPDGALYFFDQDRIVTNWQLKRLFTDTDMHNPVLRKEMEEFYHYLQTILHYAFIPSKNYDLVLDILPTKHKRVSWSYYYACHETRCLFWLDSYDATQMISELLGVRSPAHIRHRLESLYWNHWSLFPVIFKDRRLDLAVVDELVGVLSHGCMDVMTSQLSTLPYDADTMQKMLELVRNAKESDAGLVYHTTGVTRLLSYFAHWRFLYFHGQDSARLERHKTVYTHPDRERTLLITSLSPALFLAPEGYLRELEKVWIDDVVFERDWRKFISGLLKEWEQLILSSTVVLSVNVGFLTIPGVIVSNINSNNITSTSELVIFTSPAQIASCMSIVASAGSVVIGLLLVRRNSAKQNEDPAGASNYLFQITHRVFGLEPMAIVFSLPWALLMWS